jgi:hypothetical protein
MSTGDSGVRWGLVSCRPDVIGKWDAKTALAQQVNVNPITGGWVSEQVELNDQAHISQQVSQNGGLTGIWWTSIKLQMSEEAGIRLQPVPVIDGSMDGNGPVSTPPFRTWSLPLPRRVWDRFTPLTGTCTRQSWDSSEFGRKWCSSKSNDSSFAVWRNYYCRYLNSWISGIHSICSSNSCDVPTRLAHASWNSVDMPCGSITSPHHISVPCHSLFARHL